MNLWILIGHLRKEQKNYLQLIVGGVQFLEYESTQSPEVRTEQIDISVAGRAGQAPTHCACGTEELSFQAWSACSVNSVSCWKLHPDSSTSSMIYSLSGCY